MSTEPSFQRTSQTVTQRRLLNRLLSGALAHEVLELSGGSTQSVSGNDSAQSASSNGR